jgi:type I restriction enzyme M protein
LVVLRRLDCVLARTKDKVLAKHDSLKSGKVENIEPILNRVTSVPFHNTSKLDFEKLKGEPDKIAANLTRYIKSFSSKAREILEYFGFEAEIAKLDEANRLYLVIKKFCDIDLHPEKVPNIEMGYIFEELIRKFNEAANETAGDHFTPREVIRLMVNLLFEPDNSILTKKGLVRTLLDPACGTGGMLSVATDYLHELNPDAILEAFGQDWNKESYAVCGSDMLIKGQNIDHIVHGSSFSKDGFYNQQFDYMLANPPFGVEWTGDKDFVTDEHEKQGFSGRFGAGLPRINDGSLLFLQHMISKMKPAKDGGSRIAIVFNGSPLFTGDAASGESEIRRWIIENDWLEAIVALPDQLFYNTGIYTYIWVVTNRKRTSRKGKVQLINAVSFCQKMRKSLGNKRNEIGDGRDGKPDHIAEITKLYGSATEGEFVKIFDNTDFAYRQVTIERPLRLNFQASPERISRIHEQSAFQNLAKSKKKLGSKAAEDEIALGKQLQQDILAMLARLSPNMLVKKRDVFVEHLDAACAAAELRLSSPLRKAVLAALSERDETADICTDADGNPEADSELRDYENVPYKQDVTDYFEKEVKPHVPDAWVNLSVRDEADGKVGRVGYEIPLTRHFYKYVPPRPLEQIEADIAGLEKNIVTLLREVVG